MKGKIKMALIGARNWEKQKAAFSGTLSKFIR